MAQLPIGYQPAPSPDLLGITVFLPVHVRQFIILPSPPPPPLNLSPLPPKSSRHPQGTRPESLVGVRNRKAFMSGAGRVSPFQPISSCAGCVATRLRHQTPKHSGCRAAHQSAAPPSIQPTPFYVVGHGADPHPTYPFLCRTRGDSIIQPTSFYVGCRMAVELQPPPA